MNPAVAVTFQMDKRSDDGGEATTPAPEKKRDPTNWFVIRYADFCYGDKGGDSASDYKKALEHVLKKPKNSEIAY